VDKKLIHHLPTCADTFATLVILSEQADAVLTRPARTERLLAAYYTG
jgi:hypothetical protein